MDSISPDSPLRNLYPEEYALYPHTSTLTCSVCQQEKPTKDFYMYHWKQRWTICNDCASVGKHCSKCGTYMLFEQFPPSKNTSNRGNVDGYCYPCRTEARRKEYKQNGNQEHRKARVKDYHLQTKYNITREQYDAMYEAQHGLCAACGKPETRIEKKTGLVSLLAVDHNHETQTVRALLCYHCNVAFGHLKEDPDTIRALAAYAEKWNENVEQSY